MKSHSPKISLDKISNSSLTDCQPVGENITNKKPPKFKKKINKKIIWTIVTILALGSVVAALVCAFVCR